MLSGECLGYLDPHEAYVYVEQPRRRYTSSFQLHLVNDRAQLQTRWHHQMLPYQLAMFGGQDILTAGRFNGTLFRFPLRTEKSELCDTIYSMHKILTLFNTLKSDGNLVLLFLKHLESIRLLHRKRGQEQPVTIFEIRIAPSSLSLVRDERSLMLAKIMKKETTKSLYQICIDTKADDRHPKTESFTVYQYFQQEADQLAAKYELDYLPWVGLAIPWSDVKSTEQSQPQGHIFCFLPLPLEKTSPTGLHCHVNGYFAVEQNRRHIKWLSADQDVRNVTDKALLWNIHLVEELLPKALSGMVAAFPKHTACNTMDNKDIWRLVQLMIPNPDLVTPLWKSILKPIYQHLIAQPVFYTEANGGQWLHWNEAILDDQCHEDTTMTDTLHHVLIKGKQNVVKIHHHILKEFDRHFPFPHQSINQALVRSTLLQTHLSLTGAQKLHLLHYLARDRIWSYLDGLNLIPLADKGFANFCINSSYGDREEASAVYIDDRDHPRQMFPGLDYRFLDKDSLEERSLQIMLQLANQGI